MSERLKAATIMATASIIGVIMVFAFPPVNMLLLALLIGVLVVCSFVLVRGY